MKLTIALLAVCFLAALATAAPHAGQDEETVPEPAPPAPTDAPVEPPTEPAATEEPPCDHDDAGSADAPKPDEAGAVA